MCRACKAQFALDMGDSIRKRFKRLLSCNIYQPCTIQILLHTTPMSIISLTQQNNLIFFNLSTDSVIFRVGSLFLRESRCIGSVTVERLYILVLSATNYKVLNNEPGHLYIEKTLNGMRDFPHVYMEFIRASHLKTSRISKHTEIQPQ